MRGFPQVVFLKNVVTRPNILVGDFTYYDDPDGAERFEERNVLYHYDFIGDRLVIGRFCAIACGATFIMNGANHALGGISTYPFHIFGQGWEQEEGPATESSRGDTVIGHDVWIGSQATVLPGIHIGNGAIIGAHAVIGSDVPAYAVAVGNPARVVRLRFAPETIAALEDIAWWDWSAEKISRNLVTLRNGDIDALRNAP